MWYFRTMADNQLEVLDTRALPPNLTTLDLSFNLISDIKYGFSKFTFLEELILNNNLLKSLLSDFSSPSTNPSLLFV